MKPATLPSHPPPAPEALQHPGAISPVFVIAMISLTAILALGMVFLVFYRSQSVVEPTAAAEVVGDPSLDGAEITVRSGEQQIVSVTLSADNQFATPILLQPGLYRMQVILHGKPLMDKRFSAQTMRYAVFALPTALVVEGNNSLAGAAVQVSSDRESPTSVVLDPENAYCAVTYHSPGTYHLIVAHDGRIIRDQSVTIAAHKPCRISLLSPIDVTHFSDQNQ